jgi:hypothetical protein
VTGHQRWISPPTLVAQVTLVIETWKRPASGDSAEAHLTELDTPLQSLALVLAGKRSMRLSTDRDDFTRARCTCLWVGGPWEHQRDFSSGWERQENFLASRYKSGRELAGREFARHICNPVTEEEGSDADA